MAGSFPTASQPFLHMRKVPLQLPLISEAHSNYPHRSTPACNARCTIRTAPARPLSNHLHRCSTPACNAPLTANPLSPTAIYLAYSNLALLLPCSPPAAEAPLLALDLPHGRRDYATLIHCSSLDEETTASRATPTRGRRPPPPAPWLMPSPPWPHLGILPVPSGYLSQGG